MINVEEIKKILRNLERGRDDPLLQFVLQGEPDALTLHEMREDNLRLLFETAKKYKVRYIYIGESEICGCEGKHDGGGTWPAMWAIGKAVGFPASCGNHDQYQCNGSGIVFPADSYGAWDLKTGEKLTPEEEATKKFCKVVEGFKTRNRA